MKPVDEVLAIATRAVTGAAHSASAGQEVTDEFDLWDEGLDELTFDYAGGVWISILMRQLIQLQHDAHLLLPLVKHDLQSRKDGTHLFSAWPL